MTKALGDMVKMKEKQNAGNLKRIKEDGGIVFFPQ